MPNLQPSTSTSIAGSQTSLSSNQSTNALSDRFKTLINDADDRVRSLRKQALDEFSQHEARMVRFAGAQARLKKMIRDRVAVLTSQRVFSDAQLTYFDGLDQGAEARSKGCTTTVTLPLSATRHKQMAFSFHVSHDIDVENVIIEYRLKILPVFVKFVSHDQVTVPIAEEDGACIVDWIDAKLIGFVETYFDVLFHPEYQKPHLAIDPVLGIQFPKSMATGQQESDGTTIYFFTEESSRLFNEQPSHHLGTASDSTVESDSKAPISPWNE